MKTYHQNGTVSEVESMSWIMSLHLQYSMTDPASMTLYSIRVITLLGR